MGKLFSYILRNDSGAAPNPYWGVCTLVICKPTIRRTAEKDDWIVGFGSTNSPIGDIHGKVVYAMQVKEKLTLSEYDERCKTSLTFLKNKIPDWNSTKYLRRVGDCIYDYTGVHNPADQPKLREGVHKEKNKKSDLGGKFALLSTNFYYFGDRPIEIAENLKEIVNLTQGHRSIANAAYIGDFQRWFESLGKLYRNRVIGKPQMERTFSPKRNCSEICSQNDLDEAEIDENLDSS